MPVPPLVADLVARFEHNRDAYRSGHYNEAQLRKEFIDPLFKALGVPSRRHALIEGSPQWEAN